MAIARLSKRTNSRGATLVELAAIFAVGGSLLAVAIPAFVRHLSSSRFVEPVNGLERIGADAIAYATLHTNDAPFPPSAPLTPSAVPRGVRAVDAPGTWDGATWKALDFAIDEPHAFAFSFDSTARPNEGKGRGSFVARAHGDLDGDGVTSTFEIRGHAPGDDRAAASIEPGMTVESELE